MCSGAYREKKDASLRERYNSIICYFDPRSPLITAFHIYGWIHEKLRLLDDVHMIEIGGQMRRVYIKFANSACMQTVLQDAKWQLESRKDIGEQSQVIQNLRNGNVEN